MIITFISGLVRSSAGWMPALVLVLVVGSASGFVLVSSSTDNQFEIGEKIKLIAVGAKTNVTFQLNDSSGNMIFYADAVPDAGSAVTSFYLPSNLNGTMYAYAAGTGGLELDSLEIEIVERSEPVKNGSGKPYQPFEPDPMWHRPITVFVIVFIVMSAFATSASWALEPTKWKWLGLFAPLYHRIMKEDVLDNEIRGAIFGVIVSDPGIHYTLIKQRLNLKNGTLAHHLYVLEDQKKVKSQRDGVYRRFYPRGVQVIHSRKHPTKVQRTILSQIEETPGLTQKQLSQKTGLSQQRVSYNLLKMRDDHYIVEINGKAKRYILNGQPPSFTCPRCENQFTSEITPKLCPNCGADMIGEWL